MKGGGDGYLSCVCCFACLGGVELGEVVVVGENHVESLEIRGYLCLWICCLVVRGGGVFRV